MKTKLIMLLFFVVLGAAFTSCKTQKAVLPTTTVDSVKTKTTEIVKHDTVFRTQTDSSYYHAFIECRDGKAVIIQPPVVRPGKYLTAPKVVLQNNELKVDCYAKAQELFASWKDTYVKEYKGVTIRVPYAVPTPLSWWQKTEIIAGRVFLGLLAAACIVGGLRLLKFI